MSVCKQNPIRQISTSADASDAVLRDLQQIIKGLNQAFLCLTNMADAINTFSKGSFASGDGSVTDPNGGTNGTVNSVPSQRFQSAVDFSLPDGFSGLALIDATANINVSLPYPIAGNLIQIRNVNATNTITVKDNAAGTLAPTIMPKGYMTPLQSEDSANLPVWCIGAMVQYPNGTVHVAGDIAFIGIGMGPVVQSPNGNYQLLGSSNVPAPVASTFGAVPPDS